MSNCYVWKGTGQDQRVFTLVQCATTPRWVPGSQAGWSQPADGDTPLFFGWLSTGNSLTLATSLEEINTLIVGTVNLRNQCTDCLNNSVSYDCINGGCIGNRIYNTPGFYKSLSECQTACGTGCGGKCLSSEEWAQIQGLSNQLRNKNCS